MKQTIRIGTFETNSSSTHSLILVNVDEFEKFKNKELYFYIWGDKFLKKEEIAELEDFKSEYPDYKELDDSEKETAINDFICDFSECDYPVLGTYHSMDI